MLGNELSLSVQLFPKAEGSRCGGLSWGHAPLSSPGVCSAWCLVVMFECRNGDRFRIRTLSRESLEISKLGFPGGKRARIDCRILTRVDSLVAWKRTVLEILFTPRHVKQGALIRIFDLVFMAPFKWVW